MPVHLTLVTGEHPCGHCMTKHHENCVRTVSSSVEVARKQDKKVMGPGLVMCPCTNEEHVKLPGKCRDCGKRYASMEDLTDQWVCVDHDGCVARISKARESNPVLAWIHENKENRAMAEAKEKKERKPAAPKVGECVCCGGATKGGNFLPGHDARYVSERVALVLGGQEKEAPTRKALEEISSSLAGKFTKSLGLARERAAKAKEAEKEKAAAAKEKAAAEKKAPAKRTTKKAAAAPSA